MWRGAGAFLVYLVLSCFFFGRGLIGQFSTFHVGVGADAPLMIWYLVWWPHALATHIDPFLTHAFWAPDGFNLTWSTSIPLPSLVAAPITAAIGPVASLNVICLLSLPVAAWSAYLLCNYISKASWCSLLGGYIFGFSPMLLGQIYFGRVHSIWVFSIPLILYLTARRLHKSLAPRWFVALLVLLLITQFFSSTEIFATLTFFGALALVLAWSSLTGDERRELINTASNIACAYAAVLVLISPYLHVMFFDHRPFSGPLWDERLLSADLLNFIVPTPLNQLGTIAFFDHVSAPFNRALPSEQVAYLSWPLIVIAVLFAREFWRRPLGRLLVDLSVIVLACSLGQTLIVDGDPRGIPMPWVIFGHSLLANAAPGRFCMYAFLIFALMVSLWLSNLRAGVLPKIAISLVVIAALAPNVSSDYWISPVKTPEFFRAGNYRSYIARGENVFIFPVWPEDDSMIWQAQSGMYFNMAEGPAAWPDAIARWPVVESFTRQIYLPDAPSQFLGYLISHKVTSVIVADGRFELWKKLLADLPPPIRVGGVRVYKLPDRADDPGLKLEQLRPRFDEDRLERLISGVDEYLAKSGKPVNLSAENSPALGLIPAADIVGLPLIPGLRHSRRVERLNTSYRYGMVLLTTRKHLIVIGESVWYPDAVRLLRKYRGVATKAGFADSHGSTVIRGDPVGIMVMMFDRAQLAKAAAIARAAMRERSAPSRSALDQGKSRSRRDDAVAVASTGRG